MAAREPREESERMKKSKKFPYLALAFLVLWCPLFMAAWNKDKPSSSTSLRNSNPEILANWSALETSLDSEHDFGSSTQTGSHTPGSARCFFQDAQPTTQIDGGSFAATDLGSLWFDTNSSPDNQFYVLTATTPTWTPVSTEIIATLLAAARGFASHLSCAGNFSVNVNKFLANGTTGDVYVGGTLDVVGNIDPTSYETTNGGFLDEDAMGSDAANKVASQQSIKAYIATQIAGDVPTINDSESNAMLKSHAYLTQTSGFVDVIILNTTNAIQFYVGTTNDPLGAGTLTAQQRSNSASSDSHINSFVANGKYFEIVSSSIPTIYWTPLVSGGAAPIDQD